MDAGTRGADIAITVYCASSVHCPPAYTAVATDLGRLLAQRRYRLVYGGGNSGLMGTIARSALSEGGQVTGVILRRFVEQGYAQAGHEMHLVDDMGSRKQGLEDRADAFIALPGGFGTFEELTQVLSLKQLGFHKKPIVLLNIFGYFNGFLDQVNRGFGEGLILEKYKSLFSCVTNAEQAVVRVEQELGLVADN